MRNSLIHPFTTERTFCWSIKPIFDFSKCLGVCPINSKYEKSKLGSFYTIIFSVLTFLMGVLTPILVLTIGFTARDKANIQMSAELKAATFLTASRIKANPHFNYEVNMGESIVVMILNPLVIIISSLTARITSLRYMGGVKKVMIDMHLTDEMILFPQYIQRRVKKMNCILVTLTILSFLVPTIYYLTCCAKVHNWCVMVWALGLQFANVSAVAVELQFIAFCKSFTFRFKHINNRLKYPPSWIQNHSKMWIGQHKICLSCSFVPRPSKDAVSKNSIIPIHIESENMSDYLEKLRCCHQRLFHVMEEVNRLFRFQLFISISGCFANAILNVYFAIFGYITDLSAKQNHERNTGQLLVSIIWCFYYATRFMILVITASNTASEASRAKCILTIWYRRCLNSETKEELEIFMKHLSFRVRPFSAILFHIDMSLVISAIAAGLTYVVIIIQFNLT